jgi:hypothetical protein
MRLTNQTFETKLQIRQLHLESVRQIVGNCLRIRLLPDLTMRLTTRPFVCTLRRSHCIDRAVRAVDSDVIEALL